MITATAFTGRHYALYGLARSGLATARALLASGARVTAWDSREEARAAAPDGITLSDLDDSSLEVFDSLVVTPGLPLNRHPIAERARDAGVEIIGDIELFARARPELPAHRVVGITGTNGKSTTTALIHHILTTAGVPAALGGNIGVPILSQNPLDDGGVYVLELSSYQIDLTQSLDCEVAVLLNVTPDHLDRYASFSAYADSKARLLAMQSERHAAVIGASLLQARLVEPGPGTVHAIRPVDASDQAHWPALAGPHNGENAGAAIEACTLLGLSRADIETGLRTYPGLPHRMERVREKNGVLFINDSKATNPAAAAPALAAFPSIRWILGGQAKTDSLEECEPYLDRVKSAYTIGEAAGLFARLIGPRVPVHQCNTLENAVIQAVSDSQPGDTVLLSPACASFDQFRDFEQRGDRFRDLVGAI